MAEMTVHQSAGAHHAPTDKETQNSIQNQKFGIWLYLASEVVLFSIMLVGYAVFRLNEPDAVKDVHEQLGVALVTANTFLLLMSSWAMVMGLRAIQMGDRTGFYRWIGATAVLGIVFLGGQYIEYSELAHLEITLAGLHEDFGGFGMRFYAPTFFHGVHVFVGVIWALVVLWKGYRGKYDTNPVGVELFGLYWHFVDVVWIILFTLIYLI